MCALPMPAKATITAKRIPNDEHWLDEIYRKTCFITRDQLLGAGIRFYAEAFFLQEAGGRIVLRNDILKEQVDCTVPCMKMLMPPRESGELPIEKQWEFVVEPHEFFLAERLVVNKAAPDLARLVRWVLSYYHFVLDNGGLNDCWQYGVVAGDVFLPLLIPGDSRRR